MNEWIVGVSGCCKLILCDWDGDGDFDLLVNSCSVNFMINEGI